MTNAEQNDFVELAVTFLDGEASEAQVEALNRQLATDADKRALFTELAMQPSLIKEAIEMEATAKENTKSLGFSSTKDEQPVASAEQSRFSAIHWSLIGIAASLLIALGLWQFWFAKEVGNDIAIRPLKNDSSDNIPAQPSVDLKHWRITPTGDVDFEVLKPTLVRLERGELMIQSTADNPDSLRVETPSGDAIAQGTQFYIGTHSTNQIKEKEMKRSTLKTLTRVLVMSGVVTLSNVSGSVQGEEGELLVAQKGDAPTKQAVEANSDFAVDLYHQLAKENAGENLFFSPYSISSALAMTAEGARGETAKEMGDVLRFPADVCRVGEDAQMIPWETSQIHSGMAAINQRLNESELSPQRKAALEIEIAKLQSQLAAAKIKTKVAQGWKAQREHIATEKQIIDKLNPLLTQREPYKLSVANALWGEQTYPFKKEYFDTINRHYKTGGVFPVDFKGNFEATRLRINSWVEEETNNRIKDLLRRGMVNEFTRLVLVNAIYFKGDWAVPFEEKFTQDLDFTLSSGEVVKKPTMRAFGLEVAKYAQFNADGSFFDTPTKIDHAEKTETSSGADGFALVELPYKGDDLSMVIIAPHDPTKLNAIEENLTQKKLATWIANLKQRKVHVVLPKFKTETDYTLNQTLQTMGMVRAFVDPREPNGAVFDGMSEETDPQKKLYITAVVHKAFVEVNEKGTEAAAATAVIMAEPTSASRFTNFTPTFKADRPFVYLIRDRETGSILFMGRITNPNAG